MAKFDGVLDGKDLQLYDLEKTKQNVNLYFIKYRNLKRKANVIRSRVKSSTDGLDGIGIFSSIVSDPTFNKCVKLDEVTKFIDLTDKIINVNINVLNEEEKIIFTKTIIGESTYDDIVNIIGHTRNYINDRRKSCFVKVATWFDLEVYK